MVHLFSAKIKKSNIFLLLLLFPHRFILRRLSIKVPLTCSTFTHRVVLQAGVRVHNMTWTCLCDCVNAPVCPVLCRAPMMNDIVVMDVHQHSDRLADDERDPHGSVAIVAIQETTHKPSQRNLSHHSHKGPQSKHLQRNTHQVLVEEGRHQEDCGLSQKLVDSLPQHWLIEVSQTPLVNWDIPVGPEICDRLRVPPVFVELSVSKLQQLCHKVHRRVEKPIEEY